MIGCICGRVVVESPASKSPRRPRPVAHVRPLGITRQGPPVPCEQSDRIRAQEDNQLLIEVGMIQESIMETDAMWEL